MKLGKILVLLVMTIFLVAGNCFARGLGENDPSLLADMRANPRNYIALGGAGTGVSVWLYKKSLDVQRYNPPIYNIAMQWVMYSVQGSGTTASWAGKYQYLYDYEQQKIYVYEPEKKNWRSLNTKDANGPSVSIDSKHIETAEFAFYWAYNMSFFKEPVSNGLKMYIESEGNTFADRF